jgi:ADP-ribose pyrophosphatase YjhB (NUDIX family)
MSEDDIHTHILLVLGVVEKDGTYLLARRASGDPQAGGKWSFPGGKLDLEIGDKVIELTLRKEMKEEVGIEIRDDIEFVSDDAFVRVSGHHVVSFFFLCRYQSGEAQPLEGQEEVRWLSIEEMVALPDLPEYTKKRVLQLQRFIEAKKGNNIP